MQPVESQLITQRFFAALDSLVASGSLRGRASFFKRYGLNRGNFYSIEKHPKQLSLPSCCLVYLVRDFGIDALWLLTGNKKATP